MKNIKWTAKELFDSFKSETNVDEIKELYKALLAMSIGLDEYNDAADELMDEVLEKYYWKNDAITTFIDEVIVDAAHKDFEDADFEIASWY